MPDSEIRVLFLEDDRGVAEVTKEALASRGIRVIGMAATVETTVALAARDRPDVVIADIDLVGELALGPPDALPLDGPPVLWWSGHDGRYRAPAVQAGGEGYVSKRAGLEDLVSAIRRVAAGDVTWTKEDLRARRDALPSPTNREREVLTGVAAGRLNKEIGAVGMIT